LIRRTKIGITIRQAENKDVKALTKLAARTYTEAFGEFMTDDELSGMLERNFSEEQVERYIREDVALAAELEGEMIGYAHLSEVKIPGISPANDSKQLRKLYVRQDYQNKGVGSALMEAALDHPLLKEARSVYLEVWEHNTAAQRFYKRFGFEKVGQFRFVMPSGEEADFEFIMRRENSDEASS
jgi:diamine N-acetyltransferase